MAELKAIYNDAGMTELRAVILYADSNKLYLDVKHTAEVTHDVAVNLCAKGLLRIFDTDTYYSVTSYKDELGTLTVGYGASQTATVTKVA